MKLGCIGYGNMASAILKGVIQSKYLPANEIIAFDSAPPKAELMKQAGIVSAASIAELKENADTILLCVKPKDFPVVLNQLGTTNRATFKAYISIAAGITIRSICNVAGSNTAVIRVMPNTPLLLGKGTSAVCRNALVDDDAYTFAKQLFACSGTVYELPEEQFNDVINLNGSSPAYIYLFVKTIAEFANQHGNIPYKTALNMISDTLIGSAEMLLHSGMDADALIQAVSSPGGTTVAALTAFRETGFVDSMNAGLEACVQRAEELGKS